MSSAELPAELAANPSASIAELPGSEPQRKQQPTEELHELDASSPTSTGTCVKVNKPESTPSDTPELSPDSIPESDMERWGFVPSSSTGGEPGKNGKLLSMMNIEELLDVFSELSTKEVIDYWRPAVSNECYVMRKFIKKLQRELAGHPNDNDDAPDGETAKEREEREIRAIKLQMEHNRKEFEEAIVYKEAQKNAIKAAYESELTLLSTFIDQFHPLGDSPDISPSGIQTIVQKHSLLRDRDSNASDESEYIFVRENDHIEKNIQIEILKTHVSDLEALAEFYERKMVEQFKEARSLSKKIKRFQKDEIKQNRDIVERDLQIASLNQKIGQVMKMYSPHAQHHADSSSVSYGKIDKELPSPEPSEWRSQEKKKAQGSEHQGYKEEMLARVPRHIFETDQLADMNSRRESDSSGTDVADRFQTLSVEGEEFPFYFAGTSF